MLPGDDRKDADGRGHDDRDHDDGPGRRRRVLDAALANRKASKKQTESSRPESTRDIHLRRRIEVHTSLAVERPHELQSSWT